MPLAHAPCTLIKVHGDYLDSRLKNTSAELSHYDEAMDRLLDRVFDDYGLIVCGWSAEWDKALREAIMRCPSRRYTTFWSAYRDVTGAAKTVCGHRAATVIQGMDADGFFKKLAEKVSALAELASPHPLSTHMAVATVKQYLSEDRHRIRLHDLVMGEAGRVMDKLFPADSPNQSARSLKQYEAPLEPLIAMLATGAYWGKAQHRKLWVDCFRRLAEPQAGRLTTHLQHLDNYPAYLLLYAFGIACVASGRLGNLGYVLARAKVKEREDTPLLMHLTSALRNGHLDEAAKVADPEFKNYRLPTSHYLRKRLREPLREWLPTDIQYESAFAHFEYLVAITVSDMYEKFFDNGFGAVRGLYLTYRSLPDYYGREIDKYGERWPMLRAGLFEKSLDRLKFVKAGFDKSFATEAMNLHFG